MQPMDLEGSTPRPRTLVLCFDGTGDSYDTKNTNIVRLFAALEKDRSHEQLCYYQPGIGTYVSPNIMWSKAASKIFKTIDYMFAWYLDEHIQGGYRFLMNNYNDGDKILIFGFSRGAYTARCLAGMLDKVGLLPRSNDEQISFAYQIYTDTSTGSAEAAQGYKSTFCRSIQIEFLGVWDTVSAVGWSNRTLPFSASERIVKRFRQALSLDERRSKFKPNPWHIPIPDQREAQQNSEGYLAIQDFEAYEQRTTDVKEVWFAGCHTDVGGGSVLNDTEYILSNVTLTWMLNELIEANTGIIFAQDLLAHQPAFKVITVPDTDQNGAGLRGTINAPTSGDSKFTHRTGSSSRPSTIVSVQETSPEKDSTSPILDALAGFSLYWILEFIPMKHRVQDAQGRWQTKFYPNMGRPRVIEQPSPLFHSSVKLRQEKEKGGYKPRAKYTGEVRYVD
ncbi:hypothetical protein FRB94_014333 [Tulasnella sp. JGI-2019a]|nr:hypothetical protein FRB93_008640 [Tulasnella sp. JGI-2019a]KAG9007478.1 hypothetical protein FRB94_014333 [Tulasnella sp. JGI-2019a]